MSAHSKRRYDVIVIGAGIAGASVAAELAGSASVLLLEMESQPGYHTTGRSAAVFTEIYGPASIRALTRASAAFYNHPPPGFSEQTLLLPRGVIMVARDDQLESLENLLAELAKDSAPGRISAEQARQRVPLLRPGYAVEALLDETARDIDVHSLHQGFLRRFRDTGGEFSANSEVTTLERASDSWRLQTRAGQEYLAGVVVNAGGAWADQIGALAGAIKIGLTPKRRTAMMIPRPDGINADDWPVTLDIDEAFYLKPDAGRLLISPANETPSPPCDAQPEELEIAQCVERIETAFDISIPRIETRWAGLRSFVADKCPVSGYDPQVENFFWLAGQGGYGIQSSPGLSRVAAAQVLQRELPQDVIDQGLRLADILPQRLQHD